MTATGADCARWTLVATVLASALAFIDGSVVNVALPAIGREFGAGAADLQWTINAYLLPRSALLLIGGADRPTLAADAGTADHRRRLRVARPGRPAGELLGDRVPAMVVIAIGMAGAVAPLTTAVLSSVDGEHTGTASGFNSAIARTGGLIATALAGAVIARQGTALTSAFHIAAWIGAAFALASAATAFATLAARK